MAKERKKPQPLKDELKGLIGLDGRKVTRTFNWTCEWIAYSLSEWALLDVLEYLGKLSLLIAAIVWIYEIPQRKQAAEDAKKTRHYVAWQTLNSAFGKPGNAGRADALKDLVDDNVELDNISLAGGVVLDNLNLPFAKMGGANFSRANLSELNLSNSWMASSSWIDTSASFCDFQAVVFYTAYFKNASFFQCNFDRENDRPPGVIDQTIFSGAVFDATNYSYTPPNETNRTEFSDCSMVDADFGHAKFIRVQFKNCNLARANFDNVEFTDQSRFDRCNLYEASNASPTLLHWIYRQRTCYTDATNAERWNYILYGTNSQNNKNFFRRYNRDLVPWASNQYMAYYQTNDPEAWLQWSATNMPIMTNQEN